jgi:uncharacterized protein YijF (DUF1287 family)
MIIRYLIPIFLILLSCGNTEIRHNEALKDEPISEFAKRLSDAAIGLTKDKVTYDPTYFRIKYPNGDVPADKGVCTDVVIRAYRKLDIDLQQKVHEDMAKNFKKYPQNWKLSGPDSNIDHRRVPNLMTFFSKFGTVKPITNRAKDYQPGDIVTWNISGSMTHIGIVVNLKSEDKTRYLISHNMGGGQEIADWLFAYKIIGHYVYEGR